MSGDKVILTFQAPVELAEGIRQSAEAADRSLSGEIRHAIRAYLILVSELDKEPSA